MILQDEKLKVAHVSWRAGFGTDVAVWEIWKKEKFGKVIQKVLQGAGKDMVEISVPQSEEMEKQPVMNPRQMSKDQRKELQKINREGIRDLNTSWLDTMAATSHPLQEKMSLFWHGHFACRINNVRYNQQLLSVIRAHALGNFGDLLSQVSKSPAMLQFLNNQQNRKQHPNENFAREVMELFTMGRGHYTEDDVKEGARAFTGWGYDRQGQFRFRPFLHDDGMKIFLGRKGNFNGDDVLKILLEQKATAYHITEKIYRYFVNDQPDENMIRPLAEKFYQSNYHIAGLMENIFRSDWFYDSKNVGNHIKSPVELLVGMHRAIPVQYQNPDVQILFQRILDQVLFYPPNVAGWPGGRSWIDSSTLLFRMRLPQIVYYSEAFSTRPKDMPDELTPSNMQGEMSDQFVRRFARRIKAKPQWDEYVNSYKDIPDAQLPEAVADRLLVNLPGRANLDILQKNITSSTREDRLKMLSLAVMSMPEYQLC